MKTLQGADGIRALACLMVIGHHVLQRLSPEALTPALVEFRAFILNWNVGVSGFFVLSGYLLSMPFWESFQNRTAMPGLREYAARRLARIAPGYYAALIICFLIPVPAADAVLRLVAGFGFVAGFHWSTWFPSEINAPFWSISLEVFCYALMPLGMWAMFRRCAAGNLTKGLQHWLVVLAATLLAQQLILAFCQTTDDGKGWEFGVQGGAKHWLPNYSPVGFFAHYVLGVMAAGSLLRLRQYAGFDAWRRAYRFDIGAAASIVTLFAWLWLTRNAAEFSWSFQAQPYFYPVVPMLFALTLALLAASKTLGRWADNRLTRQIATLSFGLYLWHYAVIEIMQRFFAEDFKYAGITTLERFFELNLIMIGITAVLALLSWHLIERPALHAVRRRFGKPKTAAPAPVAELR